MSYSKHKDEAVQFLKFMQTPAALKIVSAAGLIPDVRGYKTTNPVLNEMLDLSAKQGYAKYPMLDNVIQPEIVTVGKAARRRVRRHDLRPEGAGRHDVDPRRHSRRSQRTRL